MALTVTFKGQVHSIDLPLSASISELSEHLETLTGVPQLNQKLLWKGKKNSATSGTTLQDAGLTEGIKIMLLGTTSRELDALKSTEKEAHRRNEIMTKRMASGPSKVRPAGSPSSSSQYRFHRIEPLKHLPNPEEAISLLTKLANDPAILHVMQLHEFSVGLLTELAPHEHPNLLGLNENAGQSIKLRIRTDKYDGFRLYSEIRRVALHELTHNVWGDHDDKFKTLNSQLNREVAQFEVSAREGAHTLMGSGAIYEPASDSIVGGLVGGTNVLGGGGGHSELLTIEERRKRTVEAAMKRFEEQEKEIEDKCATSL